MNFLKLTVFLSVVAMTISSPLKERNTAMEVPGLYEGDIKLPPKSKTLLFTATNKWTRGIVPYIIDTASFTTAQLSTINAGMRLIETQTGSNGNQYIKFIPRTTEANYIRIQSLRGCYSYLGMIGGVQTLSLQAGGCTYVGTVAHELIHALGFLHEQSRADRDTYITVNYANIRTGYANQFDKQTTNYNYQALAYDINSIMHYGAYAFSSNSQPTIVAKQAGITLLEPYDKTSLSTSDVEALRKAYPATGTIVQTTTRSVSTTRPVATTTKLTTKITGAITTSAVSASFINRGTTAMAKGDDNFVTLTNTFNIPIFQKNYTKFTVSTNGFVFLSSPSSRCCNIVRPRLSNLLSVYNADLITTRSGAVYYRSVEATSTDLAKIQNEINLYLKTSFVVKNALVITYENVRSYYYSNEFINAQLVLSTNGIKTYVTITYATCLTSTRTRKPLTEINCLTSTNRAVISSIVNPCKSSNVNVPGKWVFDVSNQCQNLLSGR